MTRRATPRTTADDSERHASTSSATARSGPSLERSRVPTLPNAADQALLGRSDRQETEPGRLGPHDRGAGRHRDASALSDAALAQIVYTADPVPDRRLGRDRRDALHARRLRGADAVDPRRVPAAVRGGHEPAPRHGHGEHVRGDLPVRARRHATGTSSTRTSSPRRPGPGRAGRSTSPPATFADVATARRLRALRRGRLAGQRGRDPAERRFVGGPAYSLAVADAPWRCSQCGTVNEPVANACRTCGRWPSLFDLEQSTIEADMPAASR